MVYGSSDNGYYDYKLKRVVYNYEDEINEQEREDNIVEPDILVELKEKVVKEIELKPTFLAKRREKVKRLLNTYKNDTVDSEKMATTVNSLQLPEVRKIVFDGLRAGEKEEEILTKVKDKGYFLNANELKAFVQGRTKMLNYQEAAILKNSIFHDTEALYESINKTVQLISDKIETWNTEGMDKELLVGISQLREYQKMALEKLGEIKNNVNKVENQYNQTNVIIASHQTDYLKELEREGKIEIKDEMLRDLIYGRKLEDKSQLNTESPVSVVESQQG